DLMLYSGGFFDQHDRQAMNQIRQLTAEGLADFKADFHDKRLPELLFRYRCPNYPDTLDQAEKQRWLAYCQQKLTQADQAGRTISSVRVTLTEKLSTADASQKLVLEELNQYIERLCIDLEIETA